MQGVSSRGSAQGWEGWDAAGAHVGLPLLLGSALDSRAEVPLPRAHDLGSVDCTATWRGHSWRYCVMSLGPCWSAAKPEVKASPSKPLSCTSSAYRPPSPPCWTCARAALGPGGWRQQADAWRARVPPHLLEKDAKEAGGYRLERRRQVEHDVRRRRRGCSGLLWRAQPLQLVLPQAGLPVPAVWALQGRRPGLGPPLGRQQRQPEGQRQAQLGGPLWRHRVVRGSCVGQGARARRTAALGLGLQNCHQIKCWPAASGMQQLHPLA